MSLVPQFKTTSFWYKVCSIRGVLCRQAYAWHHAFKFHQILVRDHKFMAYATTIHLPTWQDHISIRDLHLRSWDVLFGEGTCICWVTIHVLWSGLYVPAGTAMDTMSQWFWWTTRLLLAFMDVWIIDQFLLCNTAAVFHWNFQLVLSPILEKYFTWLCNAEFSSFYFATKLLDSCNKQLRCADVYMG